MEITTTPMSNEEIVENLKTMVFGKQAFERFNAKERETLDRAWNIIDKYENRLRSDMMTMLEELKAEFEVMPCHAHRTKNGPVAVLSKEEIENTIQKKIDKLKE